MKLPVIATKTISSVCIAYWVMHLVSSFFTNFDMGHQQLIEEFGEEKVIAAYENQHTLALVNTHLDTEDKHTVFQNATRQQISKTCTGDISNTSLTPIGRGLIFDRDTGLYWKRCPVGQKRVGKLCDTQQPATMYTLHSANMILAEYNFEGFNDWRVPSLEEISTIYSDRCGEFNVSTAVYKSTNRQRTFSNDDGDILIDLSLVLNDSHQLSDNYAKNGLQIVTDGTSPRQGALFLVRGGTGKVVPK